MTENSPFPQPPSIATTSPAASTIEPSAEDLMAPVQPTPAPTAPTMLNTSNTVPAESPQNQASGNTTPTVNTIVTILALFFVPLIGLILMWAWTNWSKTLKIVLTVLFLVIPLVLGILAILAVTVLVAINPARQIARARDAKRQNDVTAIVYAVNEYRAVNNMGPSGITSSPKVISNKSGDGGVNLCTLLVPEFLAELPVDPVTGSNGMVDGESVSAQDCTQPYSTGYSILLDENQQYTVEAKGEVNPTIIAIE